MLFFPLFREMGNKVSKSTKGRTVETLSHPYSISLQQPKAKRPSEVKAAAGSYEHIPSEKSIRSDSRVPESESTDCGSDLRYCLIKINLVCPTVRVKDGTRKSRLLSISSFLTIERRRQQSEIRRQQRRQFDI